jgi:hypothetical protein
MKRSLIAALALLAGTTPAVLAATSSSKTTTTTTTTTTTSSKPPVTIGGTVVLGATKTPVIPPVCPTAACNIVLTRATGLETIRDGVSYPTTVKYAGTLVAFTVGLAKLSNNSKTALSEISRLDANYGGVAQAGITVLKPGPAPNRSRFWSVAGSSPLFHLQPYLGFDVQFPLATQIPVVPGETVALTVPTWAPVLSYNLSTTQFSYRQSRKSNCSNPGAFNNAQLTIGQGTNYVCDYAGTRVEYNVTEITTPPVPKHFVH